MTALDPAVLRAALYTLPLLDAPTADALALALLPDLPSGERMGRVVNIRHYADQWRLAAASEIDFETVTPRRHEETMHDHGARAVSVSRERLAMAVDAAVGVQVQADEDARRTGQYTAGLPKLGAGAQC